MKALCLIFTFSIIAAISHATRPQPQINRSPMLYYTKEDNNVNRQRGTCNYKVIIKTSCRSPSYTTDRITISFGDVYGDKILSRPDPSMGLFQQCETNTFMVHADCIDKICNMNFLRVGTYGWMPEYATVYYSDYPPVTFNFDSFIHFSVFYDVDYCISY